MSWTERRGFDDRAERLPDLPSQVDWDRAFAHLCLDHEHHKARIQTVSERLDGVARQLGEQDIG